MRFLISIISLTLLLSACATPKRTMAGKIGCPEDEINIFDISHGYGYIPTTWRASCRGHNFVCSVAPGRYDLNEMSCTTEVNQTNFVDQSEN